MVESKNKTKEINQAVKNNLNKFPDRFVFRITEKEYNFLKSNNLTSKGGSKKGHTVFTEQGIYMLSTINIMDAFVLMRKYLNY